MMVHMLMLGLSLALSPLLAHAQAPCAPTVTTNTAVTLAWDTPAQPAGVTALAYVMEYQEDGGAWIVEPAPALTATQYPDIATGGKTTNWRLRLQVRLADGTIALSDYATYGTPPPCVQVVTQGGAGVPMNFTLTPQRAAVLLAWENTSTLPVRLQRRRADRTAWTLVTVTPGSTTSYLDTGLKRNTGYCFRARYDQTGTTWTPVACATTR